MLELTFEELEQRLGKQEASEYLKELNQPITEAEYEQSLLEEIDL